MVKTVTFLHTSDLHLGAPFKGLRALSPSWADRLVKAIPQSYERLIQIALDEQVDFVVFAGDVFDTTQPSYADFALFVDGMKRLEQAQIPVYFCTGNHDPYTLWQHTFSALPSNMHLFDALQADFKVFEKDGTPLAVLGGRSYYNQAWPEGEDISEGISRAACALATGVEAPFAIGVIHTGLNIDPTRSPVNPKKLLTRNMDYWACGHIHQRLLFPEKHPVIVFSGCPQGRDIKEQGEHGVFKVTLTENCNPELTFFPTATVVWEQLKIDVSGCKTIAEIRERITNEQFLANSHTHCQNMVCRVTLKGATNLHKELTESVLNDLRDVLNRSYPFFFVDSIVNHTRDVQDIAKLTKEGLFPSVYLQVVEKHASKQNETQSYLEKQFVARGLSLPNNLYNLKTLYREAEGMVLDLLSQGDGHE